MVEYFWELNLFRPTPSQRLSTLDVLGWAALTGRRLSSVELSLLAQLDLTYLKVLAEARQ